MTVPSTESAPELVRSSRLPSEVGIVMTTAPTYIGTVTTTTTATDTFSSATSTATQTGASAVSAGSEEDPVLVWLADPDSRRYENHWVALDSRTGKFLGMADALSSLRMWQARNAMVLYVDPLPENWSDE
jgi:hypothetical protein